MGKQYILDDDGNPVLEPDLLTWAAWYEAAERHVADTTIETPEKVRVSTVFLSLDHGTSSRPDAPPVLWETMVFGGPDNEWCERYESREGAVAGHERIVTAIRAGEKLSESI